MTSHRLQIGLQLHLLAAATAKTHPAAYYNLTTMFYQQFCENYCCETDDSTDSATTAGDVKSAFVFSINVDEQEGARRSGLETGQYT